MSEEKPKEKKPFLKKGTRQFLSNAQVRSQTSKPAVVDFSDGQHQGYDEPQCYPKTTKTFKNQDQQINVTIKPNSTKAIPKSGSIPNKKQDRPPAPSINSGLKPKRDTSGAKKKQATLSDYLDNQFMETPAAISQGPRRSLEKNKSSSKKSFEKDVQPTKKGSLLSANLVRQDMDSDDENPPNFVENNSSFRPIQNPCKKISPVPVAKKNPPSFKQDAEEVKFISDESDSEGQVTTFGRRDNFAERIHRKQNIVSNQENTNSGPSKVKMNYFNKNGNQGINKNVEITPTPVSKPLTIQDISKQLREQIVKEAIAEKQQQLQSQLQKLKEKVVSVTKTKEKLEEEHRAMGKARQEFEKEMQERQRQFEQKIKSENSKLAREKKYMKETQMSNKGDWKAKNEVAELKKALEDAKDEKRKSESRLKAELQNLRKKLNEEINRSKLLAEQVKILEYGKVIQQEQIHQQTKQHKKSQAQLQIAMWPECPQSTYLSRMISPEFSLIDLDLLEYAFEANEYYQYYLSVKDQYSPLDSESADNDRVNRLIFQVKRIYKNGKIEHEHFGKFLKEIFPFRYAVVNFLNGDIKQTLPEGIIIYTSNTTVSEYTVKTPTFTRKVIYFPKDETVQMEFTDSNDLSKSISEVFNGQILKRTFPNGNSVFQKREQTGNQYGLH